MISKNEVMSQRGRQGLAWLLLPVLLLANAAAMAQVPSFTASSSFSLPASRTLGVSVVLGTLAAENFDSTTHAYSLGSVVAAAAGFNTAKFTLSETGELSFSSPEIEDVALNASYALSVSVIRKSDNQLLATAAVLVTASGICERLPVVRDAIVARIGPPCEAVIATDLASISSLELFSTDASFTHLPNGSFAGLSNLTIVELAMDGLLTLGDEIFADPPLSNLKITGADFTEIPPVILGLLNLSVLEISGTQLTALPQGFSFAEVMSPTSGRVLDLNNNQLSSLPPGIFEEIELRDATHTSLARLNLDGNPGAPFAVPAAIEFVAAPADMAEFRVVSGLPGPAILFDWTAYIVSDDGQTQLGNSNGSVLIPVGRDASNVFVTPPLNNTAVLSYTATVDDGYTGFEVQGQNTLVSANAPFFNPPVGYNFSITNANPGEVVGTVSAVDPRNGQVSYTIIGGAHSANYAINSNTGVLSYDQNSAIDRIQEIIVEAASDNSLATTTSVRVVVENIVPSIAAAEFSLPVRIFGEAVLLGTVAVVNADTTVLTYGLPSSDSRFSMGSDGVLFFTGTEPEDVSFVSVYTVEVQALLSDSQLADGNITINVGICDRTEAVRQVLVSDFEVASCADVRLEHLGEISTFGLTSQATVTSLRPFDFGGLNNLTSIDLSSNQLSTLPSQIFAGLSSLTDINVSDNVNPIMIPLWAQLEGEDAFRVRSALPGPVIGNIRWQTNYADDVNLQTPTNAEGLSIAAGEDATAVEQQRPNEQIASVVIIRADIASNYQGFSVQLLPSTVVGAPLFSQPAGYFFSLAIGEELVGEVSAVDNEGDTVSYAITQSAHSDRYQISSSGRLSYKGQHNETEQHVVTVVASDGVLETQVTVTIVHDTAPVILTKSFYLPVRNIGEEVLLGTVVASDAEGQPIIAYTLIDDNNGRFSLASITNGANVLYFNSNTTEDITTIPAYTLVIQSETDEQSNRDTLTLNVGICDRLPYVRELIIATIAAIDTADPVGCERISLADLAKPTQLDLTGTIEHSDGSSSSFSLETIPNVSLQGLINLNFLKIGFSTYNAGPSELGDQLFVGLSSLTKLIIGGGGGSKFQELPQAVLNMRHLRDFAIVGDLNVLPSEFFNVDSQSTESFSFAKLNADGQFQSLSITYTPGLIALPPRVFEGVSVDDGLRLGIGSGELDASGVRGNRSYNIPLAIEQSFVGGDGGGGTPQFRVVAEGLFGPPLTFTLMAGTESGTVSITSGSDASNVFIPAVANFSSVRVLDGYPFMQDIGFTVSFAIDTLDAGIPVFTNQPGTGYSFSLAKVTETSSRILGTITAVSSNLESIQYDIIDGDSQYYRINNNGELSYTGPGNETRALQVVIVEASSGNDATTAEVTIHVDSVLRFLQNGPFALESSLKNTAVAIGTLTATDDDGTTIASYVISNDPSNKFSLSGNADGILYFNTADAEDISLNATYQINVTAQGVDEEVATTAVILNIGICDRVSSVRTAIIDYIDPSRLCSAITLAALAGIDTELTVSSTVNTELPDISFGFLRNLKKLNIEMGVLQHIEDRAFAGLLSLTELRLDSALTELPEALYRLQKLEVLVVNDKLAVLPEEPLLAMLQAQALTGFRELDLSGNDVTQLPPRTLEGVKIADVSDAFLDISNNPEDGSDSFEVVLSLERVGLSEAGSFAFQVVSDIAGPQITINWQASAAIGTVTIESGTTASEVFYTSPTMNDLVVSISNPQIDMRYRGFSARLQNTTLISGAPQFEQPLGYTFNITEAIDQAIVGTVAATDFEGELISYTLGGSDSASYSIGSSGILLYTGSGNETTVNQRLIISASDSGNRASTVSVMVTVNVPPQFVSGDFYLPLRYPSGSTAIVDENGKEVFVASDGNSDALTFSIDAVRTEISSTPIEISKFEINNNGLLLFNGVEFEDAALNSRYVLSISVVDGVYQRSTTLAVNVGICDRVEPVRSAIIDAVDDAFRSCHTITLNELNDPNFTGLTVSSTVDTELPDQSFIGLSNVARLNIEMAVLVRIEDRAFEGLASLAELRLASAVTALPGAIFALRNMERLAINSALNTLPSEPLLSQLATGDGFTELDLSGNSALTQLPARAFEDLVLTNDGLLNVSGGSNELGRVQLSATQNRDAANPTFYVASSVAGPAFENIEWLAIAQNGSTSGGSVSISVGSRASGEFTPPISNIAMIELTNVEIDSRFVGFTTEVVTLNLHDAPRFDAPFGYFFDIDAISGETFVGTLQALGSSGAISYAISGGAQSDSYAIDSSSGVLRYVGNGNETLVDQEVIVSASNNAGNATVSVDITVNVPFLFTEAGPFYLSEERDTVVLIGTVFAFDANEGVSAISYAISVDTSERFSVGQNSGLLYFRSAAIEDLSLTEVYTVQILAQSQAQQNAIADIVLSIGICDRTPAVMNELLKQSGESDCARVGKSDLQFQALDLSQQGIGVLKPFDFAALDNLSVLNIAGNALTQLPDALFGGLGSLVRLDLSNNPLNSLPETVFDSLDKLYHLILANLGLSMLPAMLFDGLSASLNILDLNGNQFATLPAPLVQAMNDRSALNLNTLLLHDNALTELPSSGSFDALGEDDVLLNGQQSDGVFNTLDLSGNAISILPQGVFAGTAIRTRLDVSDNPMPDGVIPLTVSMRQLPVINDNWQLEVSASIQGPELVLTYETATGSNTASSSITIPAGDVSATFAVPITVDSVTLRTVDIPSIFQGFEASIDDTPVEVGSPQFDQAAYVFDFDPNDATNNLLIGTVQAVDPANANAVITYSISSGATASRYSIDANSGELRYTANGGETIANQVLMIAATNVQRSSLVSVTLHPDTIPVIESIGTLAIGQRNLGVPLTIGTINASDADGDDILSYSLISDPSGKFDLTLVGGQGVLDFTSENDEDLSISAAYTLEIRIISQRNAVETSVTVNVGICDRTLAVRNAIFNVIGSASQDCTSITPDDLEGYDGMLAVSTDEGVLESLKTFDFALLDNINELRINGHAQLRSLPSEVFDDLGELLTLDLSNNGLERLDAPLFDDLVNLQVLNLRNNSLREWPEAITIGAPFSLTELDVSNNLIAEFKEGFAIADVADNGELDLLDLSENDLLTLPTTALSGLSIAANGKLDVSSNPSPGDLLVVDLVPVQLGNIGDNERYQVNNRLPGPVISVDWEAYSSSQSQAGSVSIAAGATTSDLIELPINAAYDEVRFSNAVITDTTRYSGFTLSLVVRPLLSGQPRFSEPDGYFFTGLYTDSTAGDVIGTVTALDPDDFSTKPYGLEGGDNLLIIDQKGVITYQGARGGVMPGEQFNLIATAFDAPLDGTVAVTVRVNRPPQINALDVFTMPQAATGVDRALGRISVSDPDNDVLDFTIVSIAAATNGLSTSDTFSINSQGFLSFIDNVAQDVTFNASYAVIVRASDDNGEVTTSVVVNVGICDRTQEVRDAIVGNLNLVCGDVSALHLAMFDSDLTFPNATFTELKSFDFAGLTALEGLSLSSNSALQSIGSGRFADLQKVSSLRINNTALKILEAGAFEGLGRISILQLFGNQLSSISEKVFAGVSQGTLKSLLLQENQLNTLPLSVFAGLTIEELNLSDNSGAPFVTDLSLRQLSNTASGQQRFVIDATRPGPAITVGWEASGDLVGSISGTTDVPDGSSISAEITIGAGYRDIRVVSAVLNNSSHSGFIPSFDNSELFINIPQFDAGSYAFSLSRGQKSTKTLSITVTSAADAAAANFIFSISGDGADRFSITNNGIFSYLGNGESEMLALTIRVSHEDLAATAALSVYIENDRVPQFIGNTANGYIFNLEANRSGSFNFGTVSAIDGNAESPSYSILDSSGRFNIDSDKGVLSYEREGERKGTTFALSVIARDAVGNQGETALYIIVVGLEFVDTSAVALGTPAYTFIMERGLPEVMAVGTVYALDSDDRAVTFTVQNNAEFSIDTNNNASPANGVLNYSGSGELTASSIAIRVMSADTNGATRSHDAIVTLEISSTITPEFDASTFQFGLNTNDRNIIIGTVSASDRNQETLAYSIEGGDTRFSFESIDNENAALRYVGGGEIDDISLTIRVTDTSGLSSTVAVLIDVSHLAFVSITDATVSVSEYMFTIARGASGAFAVGTVRAIDNQGGAISYFLSNNNGNNELFALGQEGASGVEINYLGSGEVINNSLTVQAVTQSRTNSSNVFIAGQTIDATINVVTRNDSPPEFLDSTYNFTLNAGVSGVTQAVVLGTVTATDANNETIAFSLDANSNSAAFTITSSYVGNLSHGLLSYIGNGEDASATLPDLRVLAIDGAGGTAAVTVAIPIAGVRFDAPNYAFTLIRGHAAATNGALIGTIQADDSDGGVINYMLQNGGNRFSIMDTTGNAVALYYFWCRRNAELFVNIGGGCQCHAQ